MLRDGRSAGVAARSGGGKTPPRRAPAVRSS